MISTLKFCPKKTDMEGEEMAYRLGWKERRIKLENIRETINSTVIKPERTRARSVLRIAKVDTVDEIQSKFETHDNVKTRSLTSRERSTSPGLYSPCLLENTSVFNMTTYKGFRTQQQRRNLAFARTLERKHNELFHDKEKRLASNTMALLDISKPAKIHSRFAVVYPKSAT